MLDVNASSPRHTLHITFAPLIAVHLARFGHAGLAGSGDETSGADELC